MKKFESITATFIILLIVTTLVIPRQNSTNTPQALQSFFNLLRTATANIIGINPTTN